MTTEQRPREFWCIRQPSDNERIACDSRAEAEKYYEGYQPITHVIEHSAYEAMRKERDEMRDLVEQFRAGIQNYKCQACGHYTSPHLPVNMISEIYRIGKERDEYKGNAQEYSLELLYTQQKLATAKAALEFYARDWEKRDTFDQCMKTSGHHFGNMQIVIDEGYTARKALEEIK